VSSVGGAKSECVPGTAISVFCLGSDTDTLMHIHHTAKCCTHRAFVECKIVAMSRTFLMIDYVVTLWWAMPRKTKQCANLKRLRSAGAAALTLTLDLTLTLTLPLTRHPHS